MRWRARAAIGLGVALGCAGNATPAQSPNAGAPSVRPTGGTARPADAVGEPYAWQASTRSPQRAGDASDAVAGACPARDAALERAAAYAAARELAGKPPLDAEDMTLVLRAEGAPYVWPHIWTLSGAGASRHAGARFASFSAGFPSVGERRCGVALAKSGDGHEVVVGIALDALADLDPLPTEVRVGAWLDVSLRLLVPASSVNVLVLGPRGQPHGVPSSLEGGRVRARFHADRDGPFLVQVLATVDGGPRPVAEAVVVAGTTPSELLAALPAAGEAAQLSHEPASALFEMINGARLGEGSSELRRDPRLDRVAREHAEAMRRAGRLAHDADDGSPGDRLIAAGIRVLAVGENVAHAADALHAHRTLWQSPSHRSNLLEPSYDSAGVGVASGADQTLWVCVVFARVH